jgi:protein disulfide-isomerase-like protein
MQSLFLLFLLVTWCCVSFATGKGVIELTFKNFDASIKDGSKWLVEFHAPWCSHCRNFAQDYELVAQTLHADDDVNVKVAKVDGDAERAIKSRFGITHFPSFFLIDGWSVYEFDGTRSKSNLIQWAKGDYKTKQDPLPLVSSPFGPMGLVQGWLTQAAAHLMTMYDYWINERGFSPIILVIAVVIGGITCSIFFMIALTIALSSKPKDD